MALYVSTGDGVVDYRNVDLYWGRCGREWDNRSLRWDTMVGYGVVDPYLGRC